MARELAKKKKADVPAISRTFFITTAAIGFGKVLDGKRSWSDWLVTLPGYALMAALLVCAFNLGVRLRVETDEFSFWRRGGDVVGCLGLLYLYYSTFRVDKMNAIAVLVGASVIAVVAILIGLLCPSRKPGPSQA